MSDALQNYSDALRQGTKSITKDLTRKQELKEKALDAVKDIADPIAVDKGQDLVKNLISSSKKKIAGIGKEVKGTILRKKTEAKRAVKQVAGDADDLQAKINKLIPTQDSMKVFNQAPKEFGRAPTNLDDEKMFDWDEPSDGFFSKLKAKAKSLYEGVSKEDAPSGGSVLAQVEDKKTSIKKALKKGGEDILKGEEAGSEAGGFLDPAVDAASLALGVGGIISSVFHKPKQPQVQHINSSFQVGL